MWSLKVTEKIFLWVKNKTRSEKFKVWAPVWGWVLLIYSTLYIVRPICTFLKQNTPFVFIINMFMLSIMGGLGCYFHKIIKSRDKTSKIMFYMAILLYLISLFVLRIPEEKIHIVEYGVLAFLLHRAVSLNRQGWQVYLIAFGIAALIGWGDEGIQYLLPNRYYEFRDVVINWFSSWLGLWVVFSLKEENIQFISLKHIMQRIEKIFLFLQSHL